MFSDGEVQQLKVNDIFLQAGEYAVATAGCKIRTVLGSCVSITLWHPHRQMGAMSHFLLGRCTKPGPAIGRLDARYGDHALALMLREFERVGIARSECVARIVGGGNMFPRQRGSMTPIGQQNGLVARQLLHEAGIRVVHQDLYGIGHRQVVFDVASGEVWVRQQEPGHQQGRAAYE